MTCYDVSRKYKASSAHIHDTAMLFTIKLRYMYVVKTHIAMKMPERVEHIEAMKVYDPSRTSIVS